MTCSFIIANFIKIETHSTKLDSNILTFESIPLQLTILSDALNSYCKQYTIECALENNLRNKHVKLIIMYLLYSDSFVYQLTHWFVPSTTNRSSTIIY